MPILIFLELKNFESILHGIKNSYECVNSCEYYYYYYYFSVGHIGRKKKLRNSFLYMRSQMAEITHKLPQLFSKNK